MNKTKQIYFISIFIEWINEYKLCTSLVIRNKSELDLLHVHFTKRSIIHYSGQYNVLFRFIYLPHTSWFVHSKTT